MNKIKELKSILGKDLKENIVLANYTTMKVGGQADYFFVADDLDQLVKAVLAAKKVALNFIVLGNGSNVLISDDGFRGLVIINRSVNIAFIAEKCQVIVDSGVGLSRLIIKSADHEMGGLEPLFGIPGTVGGAVYGNVGAFGSEISRFIKSITLLSSKGKIIRIKPSELDFQYRSSRLKEMKKNCKEIPIILSVKFQLSPIKKEEILKKLSYYRNQREEKQPYDKPSCGSIFKNYNDQPAGLLLDQSGAKKIKIGGAEVSKKHANFIINSKKASSVDIKEIIDKMKTLVKEKQGIELEEEIEYVGDFNG